MTVRTFTEFSAPVATITTSLTDIAEIPVRNFAKLFVTVANGSASQAFNAFEIQGRLSSTGTYRILHNAAAAFTAPDGWNMISASADMTTLGTSTTGYFVLNVEAYETIRFQASVVASTSSVTLKASGA